MDGVLHADIASQVGGERRLRTGEIHKIVPSVAIASEGYCLGICYRISKGGRIGEARRGAKWIDDVGISAELAVQIRNTEIEAEIAELRLAARFNAPDLAPRF